MIQSSKYQLHIPQMEQGELVKQTLFHLGKVTYLLDVTPSNPLSQHYLHLFHFVLIKFKDLVAKQHPTATCRHAAHNTMCVTLMYMYVHVQLMVGISSFPGSSHVLQVREIGRGLGTRLHVYVQQNTCIRVHRWVYGVECTTITQYIEQHKHLMN